MEQQASKAKFQFLGYRIRKTSFEIKSEDSSNTLNIRFNPSGIIKRDLSCYQLKLDVFLEDENRCMNMEISAIADFRFELGIDKEQLNQYFYINAPAILFPYIRAYIATLSVLAGTKIINLPTYNLSALGDELRKNTVDSDQCL
ncbi:MAG: protein-export chaperone SecB [Bacteroidales bacterium]